MSTQNSMAVPDAGQKGLILLGCPEAPAQVSLALYLARGLQSIGLEPVITGNPSARKLVEMADPDRHYYAEMIDLDACIDLMAAGEADYAVSFVLVHLESGVSYAGTLSAVSQGRVVAVVFGRDADGLADLVDFPCEKVVVATVHKPGPLRAAIAKVMKWDV